VPLAFNLAQWYDIKTIYDRITGKITVYLNNAVIATWTDPSPYSNGNYISFRSGNCKLSIDEIKVYRSRTNIANINVGNGFANELRYQNINPLTAAGKIKSISQDSAGNLSSIYYQDVNVDWTPPSNLTFVNDGKAADISTVVTQDSLSANWSGSIDNNSAIARYWYCIGTAPNYSNTLGWTSNWGSTSVTAHNLSLTNNTIYYFTIKAENGAGLFSSNIFSNGQQVDTNAVAVGIKDNADLIQLKVYPNPFNNYLNFKLVNSRNSKVKVTLIDPSGKECSSIELKEEKGFVSNSIFTGNLNLSDGIYFLKVDIDGIIFYRKLIRE